MGWVRSQQQLGTRIRKWRERLGMPLQVCADQVGLPVEEWEAVEAGTFPLTTYRLQTIASALGADPAALVTSEAPVGNPQTGAVRFRAEGVLAHASAHDRRLLSVAAEAGRVAAFLSGLLRRPVLASLEPEFVEATPWRQGYALAARARAELKVAPGPVADLVRLLESRGIVVVLARLQERQICAASVVEPGACPVIVVNSNSARAKSGRVVRPVIAHELCHILYDTDKQKMLTNLSRSNDREQALEERANAFAPAFLAPATPRLRRLREDELVVELARKWGFTTQGACWHTKNLLRLGEEKATALIERHRGKRYGRQHCTELTSMRRGMARWPDAGPFGLSLLGELAAEALEQNLISQGRAREIVRMA